MFIISLFYFIFDEKAVQSAMSYLIYFLNKSLKILCSVILTHYSVAFEQNLFAYFFFN